MNILHVITPRRYSGAERVCVELAAEFRDRGHGIAVLMRANPPTEEAFRQQGLDPHVGRISGKLNLLAPFRIARCARQVQADVIYTVHASSSLWGSLAGRLTGLPVVTHVQSVIYDPWFHWATRLMACSEAVKANLVAHGVPPERIDVVYSGVALRGPEAAVDQGAKRDELAVPRDALLIVVAAHLSPRKGHAVLLDALRLLADRGVTPYCLCLGEGPERGALEARCAALELDRRVRFTGFRSDARDVMEASDLVCLPSVRVEGLPESLLEAAAASKPAVASDIGGTPEAVVDGETGFLATPGDPASLASALEKLLMDPDLRTKMGAVARERVARVFDRRRRTDAVEAVYRRAIAQVREVPRRETAR